MTAAQTPRRVLLTPVLNEEASGLPVLQVAAALLHAGIVDEMVAADGGCTDGTTELVRRAGHRVIPPGAVSTLGKGGNVVHALRSLDLRADGRLEADDAGQAGLAGAQPCDQIVADLLLDGAGVVAGCAKRTSGRGQLIGHPMTVRLVPARRRPASSDRAG